MAIPWPRTALCAACSTYGGCQFIGGLLGRGDRIGRVRFGRQYRLDLILHRITLRYRVDVSNQGAA